MTQPKAAGGVLERESSDIDRLMRKSVRRPGTPTDFERLMKRPTDLERLLGKAYTPRGGTVAASRVAKGLGRVLGPLGTIGGILIPSDLGSGELSPEEIDRLEHLPGGPQYEPPKPPAPAQPPKRVARPKPPRSAPPAPDAPDLSGIPEPGSEQARRNRREAEGPSGVADIVTGSIFDVFRRLRPRSSRPAPIPPRARLSLSEPTIARRPSVARQPAPLPLPPLDVPLTPSNEPGVSSQPSPAPSAPSGGGDCHCPDGRQGRMPRPSNVIARVANFARRMSQNSLDNLRKGT